MSQIPVKEGEQKPINFQGLADTYHCLVCGGIADTHVLREQPDGHYYSGISFHNECLNIEEALRIERKAYDESRGEQGSS